MSIRKPRLNLFTVLLATTALGGFGALAGCEEDIPPDVELPPVDPPVDPENQDVHISKVRPPPISGGTLFVTKDGTRAIAADPDRDRVVIVDISSADPDIVSEVQLAEGAEPGRVVEDASGRIHVALRRGGKIVTLNPSNGSKLGEREVCAAPRGMAAFNPIEGGAETLVVACASGELVELESSPTGDVLSSTMIEPDLRDVVLTGDGTRAGRRTLVSSFRSTHVITVGPEGDVQNDTQPAAYRNSFSDRHFTPSVAWRMVKTPFGAAVIHQRSATVPVDIEPEQPDGYGGQVFDCGSTIVNSAVTTFNETGNPVTDNNRGGIGPVLLPVDIAVSNEPVAAWGDNLVAFIGAGSDTLALGTLNQLEGADACEDNFFNGPVQIVGPEPVAVAFTPVDQDTGDVGVIVQLREPSMLVFFDSNLTWQGQISLKGEVRADSGHELFHRNPEAATTIACASCHPEGRDDGHVWNFTTIGARRTQSLEGNVMDTAPFHWDGDMKDMGDIMTTVFEHRMGGFPQSKGRVDALVSWLENVPRVGKPKVTDTAAVERGRDLFENDTVGCATCHNGSKFTNNTTVAVGVGKPTQVPSLIGVRDRAPYMHDGCAATLHARFDESCGGDAHGDVRGLSESDIDDLVAYLDTL